MSVLGWPLKETNAWESRYFHYLKDSKLESLRDIEELITLVDASDEPDYSGKVSVAFLSRDGEVCYLQYYYGDCSHCDQWDGQGDRAVIEEMERILVVLPKHQFLEFARKHADLKGHVNQIAAYLYNN